MIEYTSESSPKPDEQYAYLDIVLAEATAILCDVNGWNKPKAESRLLGGGYHIYTTFDPLVFDALKETLSKEGETTVCSGAVTDLSGNVLAVYSSDIERNYATVPMAPYSSFKPLSVYMQAIENGTAHWSTVYRDTPYKQVENENGEKQNWPVNSTGVYSRNNVPLCSAIKHSLNTVAVKCLKDVGVQASVDFLQTSFGMSLAEEEPKCATDGEDEVLGHMALGYLMSGVSLTDMAGYYQIFSNGGLYTVPCTIERICGKNGEIVYQRHKQSKQVISKSTAQTMNRLLQEVVSPGGTGEAAASKMVQIAGKTGTGDDNNSNWFVGVTPHYSAAFWHGSANDNHAPRLFSQTVDCIYTAVEHANINFLTYAALQPMPYCEQSGHIANDTCSLVSMGYYADGVSPPTCNTLH